MRLAVCDVRPSTDLPFEKRVGYALLLAAGRGVRSGPSGNGYGSQREGQRWGSVMGEVAKSWRLMCQWVASAMQILRSARMERRRRAPAASRGGRAPIAMLACLIKSARPA